MGKPVEMRGCPTLIECPPPPDVPVERLPWLLIMGGWTRNEGSSNIFTSQSELWNRETNEHCLMPSLDIPLAAAYHAAHRIQDGTDTPAYCGGGGLGQAV